MSDTTTDGKAGHIVHGPSLGNGGWKAGPWGERRGWDPATQDYSVILRPQNPPVKPEPRPLPQICKRGHVDHFTLSSQGWRICTVCRTENSRRSRERRAA